VIDGVVCDSRGRELGPASAVLGEEHAPPGDSSGAFEFDPPAAMATTSDLLAARRKSRSSPTRPALGSPARSVARSPVRGGEQAGTMRGGGRKVFSSAPRGALISEGQMQANWDALC